MTTYGIVYATTSAFFKSIEIGTDEFADYAAAKAAFDAVKADPQTISALLVDPDDKTIEAYN